GTLPPRQPLARLGDNPRHRVLVCRRHHVNPRDAGDRRQLLDQLDGDAFALGGGIGSPLQPLDQAVGNDGAVEALLHPARRFGRAQRRDSDQEKDAPRRRVRGNARGGAAHDAEVHAERGLREFGPGGDFGRELVGLPARWRVDRRVGGTEEEARVACDLAPGGKLALVAQLARHGRQRGRIDVEHRLGLRLVAGLRVVTGEAQEVVHATGGGAHEIGLQRNAVAIAAGELEDGRDTRAREQGRRDRGGEVRAGAGAVGDVDGVRQAGKRLRLAQQVVRVARDRRRDLGGDDELPRAQQRFQARCRLPLRGGHRLVRRGWGRWPRGRDGGRGGEAAYISNRGRASEALPWARRVESGSAAQSGFAD